MLTAESANERLTASPQAAHRALTALREAGILGRSKDQKGRTICWTADRHLALVALTERSNRLGGDDTRGRKPRLGPAAPSVAERESQFPELFTDEVAAADARELDLD